MKRIAVLGAGNYYKQNRKYINPDYLVVHYADNDSSKWGKDIYGDGILCISPDQLANCYLDGIVIGVKDIDIAEQLSAQIKDLGIPYFGINELIEEYIDEYIKRDEWKAQIVVEDFFVGKEGQQRIFLLNTPEVTSTIGDHAITVAERLFIKKAFPNRIFVEIGDRFFWKYRELIKKHISPSDILLIQGGGYLGSLWRAWREDTVRYILQAYPLNRIIIMPQTMFFEDSEEGRHQREVSREIYNSHSKLCICFREKKSYMLADEILNSSVKKMLIPDTVLSLTYNGKVKERKGIAFCFKNDKETLLGIDEQEKMVRKLSTLGTMLVRTTMFYSEQIHSPEDREELIQKKMDELSSYQLLITDAMHGMVLAAVTGTPCIGVESITGKVGAMYEWLSELEYVSYANDIETILAEASRLMKLKNNQYDGEKYDGYFAKLKKEILGSIEKGDSE